MKKSKYALLSLTLIFIMLVVITGYFKIERTNAFVGENVQENAQALASTCTASDGAYYQVTVNNVYVRTGPASTYPTVSTLSKGTTVTVYCITGSWANISNNSSNPMYVSTANLKKLTVGVSLGNLEKEPAVFYRNKDFSGSLNVSVTNLPNDGSARLTMSILKDGVNAESYFSVTKTSYYNGEASISFSRKSGVLYGTYSIVVMLDGVEKGRTNFVVEKNEFSFELDKYTALDSVSENEQGEWRFSLKNQMPASLTLDDFSYSLTQNGKDASGNFDIELVDGNLIIKNRQRIIGLTGGIWGDLVDDYTKEGTYRLAITLKDQAEYSDYNGFTKNDTIIIEKRRKNIAESSSERTFSRYQIDYTNENYNVDIIGIENINGIKKYVLNEKNEDGSKIVRAKYTRLEMNEIYPNIRLDDIYIEERFTYTEPMEGLIINPVAINSANTIYITNYTVNADNPTVTYYTTGSNTPITVDASVFATEQPSAYGQLTSGNYNFDVNGYISIPEAGIGTKIVKHITVLPDRQPLSVTGGELVMKVRFQGFIGSELNNFMTELRHVTTGQLLIGGNGEVYDPSFELSVDDANLNLGVIYIKIKYTSNKEKYFGDYRVRFGFGNLNYQATFKLEDGKTDYTVYSEVDSAGTSNDPLEGSRPNANKKYDYNIGLYLKKARTDYYGINLDSIGYRIFDKRVDIDEDGNYYFFDEIEYITKVNRIADGKVYFNLSTDNTVTWQNNQVLSISDFARVYSEAYEYFKDYTPGNLKLKYYNLDESGNIISDNYSMHPVRMFAENEGDIDLSLTYINESGQTLTVLMDTPFKRANSEMYSLISTRFAYEANGNYILGAIRGRRKENIENNASLEDHDVTNQFFVKKAERKDISKSDDESQNELEELTRKTLTILPHTEVAPGNYFVYVNHDTSYSIGFLYTDDSEDSAIDLAIYPELYNRNIHMTSISYEAPKYDVTIENPIESNILSNKPLAYANIESQLLFNLTLKYIYDMDNFNYRIQYKDDANNWIDADNYFYVNPFIIPTNPITELNYSTKGLTNSTLTLTTIPGITKMGEYRLVFDYENMGNTMNTVVKEFELKANYYDININPSEVVKVTDEGEERFKEFYSNIRTNIKIPIHLLSVKNPSDIEFELVHLDSGEVNTWNPLTQQFMSHREGGQVSFSYTYTLEKLDNDNYNYLMNFKNYYQNQAPSVAEGNYTLFVRYQEGDGELKETSFDFSVVAPKRDFNVLPSADRAISKENEMFITRVLESSYVVGSRLTSEDMSYIIEMYDESTQRYVDVSSEGADIRLFENISVDWENTDVIDRINYYGNMKVNLAMDKIDRIFEESDNERFILVVMLDNDRYELEMPNLRELFKWSIQSVDITGVVSNDGENIDVTGFYNNAKPTIDINLKTIHEENAKYAITNVCTTESACSPSEDMINFNDRFDEVTYTSERIVLKQKENLADNLKLVKGNYQLVIYYSQTDYDIFDFVVRDEYASIEFGDMVILTQLGTGLSSDLFTNKNSTIRIPVSVIGIPYQNVTINITNNDQSINYNHMFTIDYDKFYRDHVLEVSYDFNKKIESGNYLIMVSKDVDGEIVEDHEGFKFNDTYFNFSITNVSYNPNPAIPNLKDGGEIIFDILTDELLTGENLDDEDLKKKFIDSIRVTNKEIAGDLTENFEITYQNTASISEFKVIFRYTEDSDLTPGEYDAHFRVSKGDYNKEITHAFTMEDYERRLTIKDIVINSNTKDNLIHRNTGGTYVINYLSNYEVNPANLYVRVTDNEGNDLTSKFNVTSYSDSINLTFDPTLHTIGFGVFKVTITYADTLNHTNDVNEVEITMYGDYKEIIIKDMISNVSPIVSENDNQFYSFTLDTFNLTTDDISNMKMRILDSKDNIVYSDILTDNVTNIFDVIKNADNTYKVSIIPYKARVGSYFVELILPEAFSLFNVSNRLELTVDTTLYKVSLLDSSKVTTQDRINNLDNIYDYIGVNGLFNFTSTSPIKDEYSIKIFKDLALVKEIPLTAASLDEFSSIQFSADEISNGEIEFALCISGLPYASITKDVLEYVKVTDFSIILDNKDVVDDLILDPGDEKNFQLFVKPDNATNKNLVFEAENSDIAIFEGNKIIVKGSGETKVTVRNKEISKEFMLIVTEKLSSDTYEIDQENKTIFVNHLTSKKMSRFDFTKNLSHLSSNYRIIDKNGNNVTYTATLIGTGYKIINGNITYTVIVIGDVNGDGQISLVDATQVYRYYRGYENFNDIKKKAAIVTRGSQIRLVDATKLYRFYRGDENEL